MRKIFFTLLLLIVYSICDAQSMKEAVSLLRGEWGVVFKDCKHLTVKDLAVVEDRILTKIYDMNLSDGDKHIVSYAADCFKIENLYRLINIEGATYDKKVLSFMRNFKIDDARLEKYSSTSINMVNSYFRLKELSVGIDNFNKYGKVISNDKRINELLDCRNIDKSVNDYLKITFEFDERYYGYQNWMSNPKLELALVNDGLRTRINNYKNNYSYLRAGCVAPDFKLKDFNGTEVTLSQFVGKVVVIDVWGTWCGSCKKAMPDFVAVKNKYASNKEVVFITIACEWTPAYKLWLKDIEALKIKDMVCLYANGDKKYGADTKFKDDYNIMGAPKYFIIGKDGKFASVYSLAPSDGEIFTQTIDKALRK